MNYIYNALFLIIIFLSTGIEHLSAQSTYLSFYDYNRSSIFLSENEANTEILIEDFDIQYLDAAIFHLTNIERFKLNLEGFKFSDNLYKSSILHSEKMIEYEFFDHINKTEKRWRTPSDRIFHFDSSYIALAENIVENNLLNYKGKSLKYRTKYNDDESLVYLDVNSQIIPYMTYYQLAERLLIQWMNSPPHRKNILNTSYNLLGCACAIDESKIPILIRCTQNFGRID